MVTRFDITTDLLGTQTTTPTTTEIGTLDIIQKGLEKKTELEKSFQRLILGREMTEEEIKASEMALGAAAFTAPLKVVSELNQVADTALTRLIGVIKAAKPVRKEIEKLASAERTRRAGAAAGVLERVEGEKAFIRAKGQLKGPLVPEKPKFEPIREEVGQSDIDNLFVQIQRHPDLTTFEKISTADGFSQLLRGEIPQPSKLSLLEDVFGKELIEETLKKRPIIEKLKDLSTEVLNIPRSLMASFDMSAPLRQGVIFTLTKPTSAVRAGWQMFRQVFSEKNYTQWIDDIKKDPLYQTMKEADLYIADPRRVSGGLVAREERFMSGLAERIPLIGLGIKAAERAYTSYLNKLRVDVFANISNKFVKEGFDPKKDTELFKALAGFINNATGRGDLGKLNRVAQQLNTLFFSPRLIASRFNLLNPVWYAKQPAPVRKEAVKSFAEFVGVGSTILGMSKLAGADVELDPRSTDFGKIRIGNTRWDIWGGFQQWARVFSQITSGERKTQKKQIIPLSKKKFPFETRLDVTERFIRGKLAPVPGLALELFEGQKMFGEEIKLSKEILENAMPLYAQDVQESLEQIGPWAMVTVGLPAFFGVGVQTYEERRKENRFNF